MGVFDRGMASLPQYGALCADIRDGRLPVSLTGLGHIHKVMLVHALCACLGRKAVFIVADEAEANRVCEDLACLGTTALLLPARDLSLRRVESTSREYEQMRLGTLAKMAAGDYQCVVACADAAAQFTLPPDMLLRRTLRLREGTPLPCGRSTCCGWVHRSGTAPPAAVWPGHGHWRRRPPPQTAGTI